MKKILLVVVILGLSNLAFAEWESGCSGYSKDNRNYVSVPYMDSNGRIYPYTKISKKFKDSGSFRDWTYLDENGYDYTVTIKVMK